MYEIEVDRHALADGHLNLRFQPVEESPETQPQSQGNPGRKGQISAGN
jgi:hypothetical protein